MTSALPVYDESTQRPCSGEFAGFDNRPLSDNFSSLCENHPASCSRPCFSSLLAESDERLRRQSSVIQPIPPLGARPWRTIFIEDYA